LIDKNVQAFIETVKKYPDYPDHLAKMAEKEDDPGKKKELIRNTLDAKHITENIHKYQLTLPNLIFQEQMLIQGSKRSALIQTMGNGHSEDDSILYLPDDHIAFVGDLVSVDAHPSLKYGNTDEWLTILDNISLMQINQFVPGHGPVGERKDVELMKEYIKNIIKTADDISYSVQNVEECIIPKSFKMWDSPSLYQANVSFLCQQ